MTKPFTHSDQPNENLICWDLGQACARAAVDQRCGGYIDRGLILLRELQALGYGIVRLEVKPCAKCGHPFDHEKLGRYGCPNCHGEGLRGC